MLNIVKKKKEKKIRLINLTSNKGKTVVFKIGDIDICTRLIPPGRVKFKTLASQNFGKRSRWIINLLLDVLGCSIVVYFYSFVF